MKISLPRPTRSLAYYKEFSKTLSFEAKKLLHISLVRSCLLYCSPLWRPYLIQGILLLEKVHQVMKAILNNYTSDCNSCLIKLLPLMHVYELSDILFFIKSPNNSFDITNYVSFSRSATRSFGTKLCHRVIDNCISSNSYFYRIPKLWNAFPEIDLALSLNTIKKKL